MSEKIDKIRERADFIEAKYHAKHAKELSKTYIGLNENSRPVDFNRYCEKVISMADSLRKKGRYRDSIHNLRDLADMIINAKQGIVLTEQTSSKYLEAITKRLDRNVGPARHNNDSSALRQIANMETSIEDYLEKGKPKKDISLEHAAAVLALIGILAGAFFIYPSITGSAIGGLTQANSSPLGPIFFMLGVLAAGIFFYQKNH